MDGRREALLGAAALALVGVAGIGAWRDRDALPQTLPIASAPGFRRLVTGAPVSAGDLLTVGLDAEGGPEPVPADALCAALFRDAGPGTPVALFTDYRCPTCPALSSRLSGLGGPALAITWHEWPILGASSVFAARVALAAGMQGRHAEMHAYLMRRGLRPSRAGAQAAAEAVGAHGARLLDDMQDPAVDARLEESAALARRFGFRGTPAAVVGATEIEGLAGAALLRRIAAEGGGPCAA